MASPNIGYDLLPRNPTTFSAKLDFSDPDSASGLFSILENKLEHARDKASFHAWLDEWEELTAAWDEHETRAAIACELNLTDAEAERRFEFLNESVRPLYAEGSARIWACLNEHTSWPLVLPARHSLRRQAEMCARGTKLSSMPMAGEEQLQVMHYTRTVGTLRFEYKGTTLDAASLSRHLNDHNEASRREAWDCQNATWSSVENELDAVFDRLRTIRLDLAQTSGFCSYPEYVFHQYGRCDYGPQQCLAYHEAAAIALPPVLKKLRKARSARIGVERLRPWDGIYATTPSDTSQVFSTEKEFLHKTSRMFHRQDDRAAALFDTMVSKGMFDVMARPGKTGGSYQAGMLSSGLPFVCMTATGALPDVSCLLHECGHAFHFIATRPHGPLAYSRIPIEFKEFAAISTEWLVAPAMDEFLDTAIAAKEKRDRIERALDLFAAVAAGDAWQFAAYSSQVTKASQRDELWSNCVTRFFGEDGADPEFRAAESRNWRRQDLFFSRPFYYIEYAIAQMAALELVARSKADPSGTWRRLWAALELGDSRLLPDLFHAAGVSLDFSPARLLNVVASLEAEWEQANATLDQAR